MTVFFPGLKKEPHLRFTGTRRETSLQPCGRAAVLLALKDSFTSAFLEEQLYTLSDMISVSALARKLTSEKMRLVTNNQTPLSHAKDTSSLVPTSHHGHQQSTTNQINVWWCLFHPPANCSVRLSHTRDHVSSRKWCLLGNFFHSLLCRYILSVLQHVPPYLRQPVSLPGLGRQRDEAEPQLQTTTH